MQGKSLLALLFILAAARISFADSLVGNFNFEYNLVDTSLSTLGSSQGQVVFTLNADGSISAALVAYNSLISGFGFDSKLNGLDQVGFEPTTPALTGGWAASPDSWLSGFSCPACGSQESWQIGDPGVSGFYSSVWETLGGGFARTNFVLFTSGGDQFGANAAAVPEPGIPGLLAVGLGLTGLGLIHRRRMCAPRT